MFTITPPRNPVSCYIELTKFAPVFEAPVNMVGKEWEGDFNPLADPDEQRHLLSVLDSFR